MHSLSRRVPTSRCDSHNRTTADKVRRRSRSRDRAILDLIQRPRRGLRRLWAPGSGGRCQPLRRWCFWSWRDRPRRKVRSRSHRRRLTIALDHGAIARAAAAPLAASSTRRAGVPPAARGPARDCGASRSARVPRSAGVPAACDECNDFQNPACGANGKTYPNVCKAQCRGVTVAYMGACNHTKTPSAGSIKAQQATPATCRRPSGACANCTLADKSPVCTKLGFSLPNVCFAECSGQPVASRGQCPAGGLRGEGQGCARAAGPRALACTPPPGGIAAAAKRPRAAACRRAARHPCIHLQVLLLRRQRPGPRVHQRRHHRPLALRRRLPGAGGGRRCARFVLSCGGGLARPGLAGRVGLWGVQGQLVHAAGGGGAASGPTRSSAAAAQLRRLLRCPGTGLPRLTARRWPTRAFACWPRAGCLPSRPAAARRRSPIPPAP